PRRRNRVEEVAAAARLHARDQVPRRIDMRHDMNGPASLPGFVGSSARVGGQRIKTAADAGVGAEQRDRAELLLGLLDNVKDILFLADIAFEGRPADRGGDSPRAVGIDIGDDDPGGAGAMEGLAHRLADAVAATGDNHDFAGYLHRRLSLLSFLTSEPYQG